MCSRVLKQFSPVSSVTQLRLKTIRYGTGTAVTAEDSRYGKGTAVIGLLIAFSTLTFYVRPTSVGKTGFGEISMSYSYPQCCNL